ncbi:MAG: folylpolyglutamate synthase/dihydrofolate synthase family protein [Candidatus Eisenbacteria bacterium]
MNYAEAVRFLYGLERGAVKLGLERIRAAIEARNHPQRRYACIHVAGTNGKGSTCALLDAILGAAGCRTGLFTSPHLLDFRERIRIDGELAGREEIAEETLRLRPLIEGLHLSFFEASTLLAFEIFARRAVEVAVIEVGMGGRLDATNVVEPALTIVTGIDLDHTQALGRSRVGIAGEKAGIIKKGVALLIGPCAPGVRRVFEERTAELGAPLWRCERRVRAEQIVAASDGSRYRRIVTGPAAMDPAGAPEPEDASCDDGSRHIRLRGLHQVGNGLLAEEAAVLLAQRGFSIPWQVRKRGLAAGGWPGRFQLLQRPGLPLTVFDVAHNPQGGATLARTWSRWLPEAPRPVLIVGMLGDKDHLRFFRQLRALSGRLHLVPLDSPRAGRMDAIARAAAGAGFRPRIADSMAAAWQAARRQGAPVVVTGSFLTVEAAMRMLGVRSVRRIHPPRSPRGEA